MSDTTTKVMLQAYKDGVEPIGFLAGQFQAPPQNFHSSEEVEIDIKRSGRKVAIAVQDLSTGARMNAAELFTNKAYKPAILREKAVVNAFDLTKRNPGEDPFQSVDFQVNAIRKAVDVGMGMNEKIQRTIELQASQVLQTGKIDLVDESNKTVYEIDFKPKTSHFPTVSASWGASGATIAADITALANEISKNGKRSPDLLEMGETAFENFIADDAINKRFDSLRIEGSGIVPMQRLGNGGIYRGVAEIGNRKYDVWTYDAWYEDPADGTTKQYIDSDKVIIRSSQGRLDATFGLIPKIGGRDPRVPEELFQRISNGELMVDIQMFGQILGNGDGLEIEVGTRPLLIPTAIDTFGCLTTTA